MLSVGIVGLPNVGKSTLFNALTRSKLADAQNYPFCTIEPNVGIVEVPDDRLKKLADISHSKKIVPTAIEFVDIAGLVKGASEGEGLGNKFLSHIREVDAICQVVRAFEDSNIIHVHNKINPQEDMEIINLELVMADWQTVSKHLENSRKSTRSIVTPEAKIELDLLERVYKQLESGKSARDLTYSEEEIKIMKSLCLLTMKPIIYVINVNEKQLVSKDNDEQYKKVFGNYVKICAKLESEFADLGSEETKEYMKELGIEQTGLDQLIVISYKLLDLITFLTSGEPETRAWTTHRGAKAPEAAGVIHTDFVKGFIKAEICHWKDFIEFNGWPGVKEKGKMRLEGKEYVMQDGDTCYFHVNV
jgi:hypothetical protein